ncbi:unnamed protein product [Chrysoparadoxa australica]
MVRPIKEPEYEEPEYEIDMQSASTSSAFDSKLERELQEEEASIRRLSEEWANSDIPFPIPLLYNADSPMTSDNNQPGQRKDKDIAHVTLGKAAHPST